MSCNAEDATRCSEGVAELMSCEDSLKKQLKTLKKPRKKHPKKKSQKTLKKP